MKYYLETNALYQINKIPAEKIKDSFTSVLSLYEIVSGITESTFIKRRNIVRKILKSGITVIWVMPENIIFKSFDALSIYNFEEKRVIPLKKLINRLLISENYKVFSDSPEYNKEKYDFEYFRYFDQNWSKGFISSTENGNKEIRQLIANQENHIEFLEREYNINNQKKLEVFFNSEQELNESFTVLALTSMLINNGIKGVSEKEIYESYNGNIQAYVIGFSLYTSNKMIKLGLPARNDFSDLTHLLYLSKGKLMVSNDKLFKIILPNMTMKIEDFTKSSI